MRSRSWWWAGSGLAETNIQLFTHLNRKFQLLATHELRALNRHNPGLDAVKVPLAGGASQLPLSKLIPPAQLRDLEEILEPYCG